MARLYLLAAALNVWVLVLILVAAFGVQLILGEPPCPLCVVQRVALMLCALGPLYMLLQARDGALTCRAIAIGSGISSRRWRRYRRRPRKLVVSNKPSAAAT